MNSPVRFLLDGSSVSETDIADHRLKELLPRSEEVGRVQFVGMVCIAGDTFMFLPKGSPLADKRQAYEIAKLTMRAISLFARVRGRLGRSPFEDGGGAYLAAVNDLVRDYLEEGEIVRSRPSRSRNGTRPDWDATIRNEPIFTDAAGRVAFLDVRSHTVVSDFENRLSSVHRWVLTSIQQQHGWWLGFDPPSGLTIDRDIFSNDTALAVVEEEARRHLPEREFHVVELMREFLTPGADHVSGRSIVGVNDFSSVWEWMLGLTIPGQTEDWKDRLPKLVTRVSGAESSHVIRRLQPDFVVRHGDRLAVIDAKYYAADDVGTLPGGPDVMKQHFYQIAIEHALDAKGRVSNIFLFPSCRSGEGFARDAVLADAEGNISDMMVPIRYLYVDVMEVLRSVVFEEPASTMRVLLENSI